MKLSEVIDKLHEGLAVRRKRWHRDSFLSKSVLKSRTEIGLKDLLAEDWELVVLSEPKQTVKVVGDPAFHIDEWKMVK